MENRTELFTLSETSKLLTVTNQEVLTKDNVALRFSLNIIYKITDGRKFLGKFALDKILMQLYQQAMDLPRRC